MPFRILVVEDHEAVRRFICSMLQQRPEFQIVGEASDGLEAVRQAQESQPDLVLLDVGLPKLNGLDAAAQIRSLVPNAKLLFLSLECSPEIVKEAFRRGAQGYVHELRAQFDLLPAVEAVLAGKQFISSDVSFTIDRISDARHEVQFYSDDIDFLNGVGRFIADAMRADNPAIVLATKPHSEGLVQRIKDEGVDIDGAVRRGTYIPLDAAATLSRIMVNGQPNIEGFMDGLIGLIESAALATKTEFPRIAIFGECVGLLCSEGNIEAAIQLERAGNDIIRTRNVDILCAYPLNAFHPQDDARAITKICAEHTAVHSHR